MGYMAAQMDQQIEGAQVAHADAMRAGHEPAFPGQWDYGQGQMQSFPGMKLRDYFAAKALPSILDGSWPDLQLLPKSGLTVIENSAEFAYQMADAMLLARAK